MVSKEVGAHIWDLIQWGKRETRAKGGHCRHQGCGGRWESTWLEKRAAVGRQLRAPGGATVLQTPAGSVLEQARSHRGPLCLRPAAPAGHTLCIPSTQWFECFYFSMYHVDSWNMKAITGLFSELSKQTNKTKQKYKQQNKTTFEEGS